MSLLKCLLFVSFCFTITGAHSIQKRSLDLFRKMIKIVTKRDAFDFNNYGEWCGFGGSGIPVDSIDRCCKEHDLCYRSSRKNECKSWMNTGPYLARYKWYYDGSEAQCTDDRDCHQSVCICDKRATSCFRYHLSEYNEEHQSFFG